MQHKNKNYADFIKSHQIIDRVDILSDPGWKVRGKICGKTDGLLDINKNGEADYVVETKNQEFSFTGVKIDCPVQGKGMFTEPVLAKEMTEIIDFAKKQHLEIVTKEDINELFVVNFGYEWDSLGNIRTFKEKKRSLSYLIKHLHPDHDGLEWGIDVKNRQLLIFKDRAPEIQFFQDEKEDEVIEIDGYLMLMH